MKNEEYIKSMVVMTILANQATLGVADMGYLAEKYDIDPTLMSKDDLFHLGCREIIPPKWAKQNNYNGALVMTLPLWLVKFINYDKYLVNKNKYFSIDGNELKLTETDLHKNDYELMWGCVPFGVLKNND